jgi:hypothetical protein
VFHFTKHAQEQMRRRRISRQEVEEAHRNHRTETPGWTEKETNLWGETDRGRRLRITVRTAEPNVIITVVAPDEDGS